MPQCSQIQTCVCYGRRILQQRCGQDGRCQAFPGGSHINRQVPETFAQSPLPIETFLHIQTWHTKHPRVAKEYALDFNVWLTGVTGLAFNISTLRQHVWDTSTEWISDIAHTNLLAVYGMKDSLNRTLWALGLDWTQLPTKCEPPYRHPLLEPIKHRAESQPRSRRTVQTPSEEASFEIIHSDSSEPPYQHRPNADRQLDQDYELLEECDQAEMWRTLIQRISEDLY